MGNHAIFYIGVEHSVFPTKWQQKSQDDDKPQDFVMEPHDSQTSHVGGCLTAVIT